MLDRSVCPFGGLSCPFVAQAEHVNAKRWSWLGARS